MPELPELPELPAPLVLPAPPVLPALPIPPDPELPAVPLLSLPVLGDVGGGVDMPPLPAPTPDEGLPESPGERVLPVSVGSDFPQALKASSELKAIAKAGLQPKVFMGLPFEKIHFKNPERRADVGGSRPVV